MFGKVYSFVGVSGSSGASSQSPSLAGTKSVSKKKHYPPRPHELSPGHTLPVEVGCIIKNEYNLLNEELQIICMESKITVVWQDGTEEKDIPSTQLYYSISLDDYEFFPGECVVKDTTQADASAAYGVVQKVDYLERTATVKVNC